MTRKNSDTPNGDKTAERALRILSILADQNTSLSAAELSALVPCSRNAAYRSLISLTNSGYVISCDTPGKFKLSLRTASLNRAQLTRIPILATIHKTLDEISKETGETCNYEELQGHEVVIIAKSLGQATNPFHFEIGQSTPAASTSIGRAILSKRHRRDAAKLLELGLEAFTEFTQTDPFKYLADLDAVERFGYSIDDQELRIGLRCVAVPIVMQAHDVYSGLAICGPIERFSTSYMEDISKVLKVKSYNLAKELSKLHYD